MCGTNNHCATANKTSELKELKRGQLPENSVLCPSSSVKDGVEGSKVWGCGASTGVRWGKKITDPPYKIMRHRCVTVTLHVGCGVCSVAPFLRRLQRASFGCLPMLGWRYTVALSSGTPRGCYYYICLSLYYVLDTTFLR
jgi:hypothetical protein